MWVIHRLKGRLWSLGCMAERVPTMRHDLGTIRDPALSLTVTARLILHMILKRSSRSSDSFVPQ